VPAFSDVHLGSRRPLGETGLIPPSEGELVDDGGSVPTIGQIVVDPHLDLGVDAVPENNSIGELPAPLISMYTSGLYLTLDAILLSCLGSPGFSFESSPIFCWVDVCFWM